MPVMIFRIVLRAFHFVETSLIVVIPLMMILLAVIQIALRNFFETSLPWIDPLLRIAVLWIGLVGAMIATRKAEHISIDLVSHYSGVKLQHILNVLAFAFSAFVCGMMVYHSGRFVHEERLYESIAFSEVPSWPFQLIMPVAFCVMSLRFFVLAVKNVMGVCKALREPNLDKGVDA